MNHCVVEESQAGCGVSHCELDFSEKKQSFKPRKLMIVMTMKMPMMMILRCQRVAAPARLGHPGKPGQLAGSQAHRGQDGPPGEQHLLTHTQSRQF